TIAMYFGEGPTPVEEIISRAGWAEVSAVKNGCVVNLDSDMLSRPGPRLVEAAEALMEAIGE
ncbi:MAG: ABC transporter substrate-binding protein, partial [Clostridia bacterium]|nr:ABC transporter substrate-binding protein [Clostridia bacterium]